VVTGAKTSIGYETARVLALRGAATTLGCRDVGEGRSREAADRPRERWAHERGGAACAARRRHHRLRRDGARPRNARRRLFRGLFARAKAGSKAGNRDLAERRWKRSEALTSA